MTAPSKTAGEIAGAEFDWLACDTAGHVALFSTAGGGYAPPEFLRDTEAHDGAIEAILALPASAAARFAPELPPNCENTWREVAERGLFVFDADVHGGPYRLVAVPAAPAHVADLPEPVRAVVSLVVFTHVRFAELTEASGELLRRGR
jgi:hypothetical protein